MKLILSDHKELQIEYTNILSISQDPNFVIIKAPPEETIKVYVTLTKILEAPIVFIDKRWIMSYSVYFDCIGG